MSPEIICFQSMKCVGRVHNSETNVYLDLIKSRVSREKEKSFGDHFASFSRKNAKFRKKNMQKANENFRIRIGLGSEIKKEIRFCVFFLKHAKNEYIEPR